MRIKKKPKEKPFEVVLKVNENITKEEALQNLFEVFDILLGENEGGFDYVKRSL